MTREEGKVFGDRQGSWSLKTTLETMIQNILCGFKNPIRRLLNSELCRSRVIQSHSEKRLAAHLMAQLKYIVGTLR